MPQKLKRQLISALLLFPLLIPMVSFAQDIVPIYFFKTDGCPHCAKEKVFLDKLKQEDGNIEVLEFELSKNPENIDLLKKLSGDLSMDVSGVPITFIGDGYFVGYQSDEIHGALIKKLIEKHRTEKCADIAGPIINEFQEQCEKEKEEQNKKSQLSIPGKINLPFFGEKDIKNLSLPVLTIVIGAIDGFNPCAMWVLIFLISLLLGMKNRKRMWILGATFIISSATVYFLFLSAWLNLFLFLGFIFWVRLFVGLTAIASGTYYLKKYFTDKADVCEISQSKKQQKIFEKLKNITRKKQLWLSLVGIVLLAGAVNLVELICSAGLPAVYTQILSMSGLSSLQYYGYLLLYIFIFMMDDMVVFAIAMITLKNVHLTKKYSRLSAIVGGILMLAVGLLLIFKPGWLMFG
ncbi:glutaredoxin family protein [Patescibacteria group bacterium]|nr:glutaredoxin family protein [Patescibacteria group bacterium]MBU2633076.1 glutaredoxin family protein [Patescibacteria group bacterium]